MTCLHAATHTHTHTHTHTFNGPLSGTTRVSRYQKGKTIWILLKQETVSGSGISWAICKSAPRSRQITMPAPHQSDFYRPDAFPATQPTASKHWRDMTCLHLIQNELYLLVTSSESHLQIILQCICSTFHRPDFKMLMNHWTGMRYIT